MPKRTLPAGILSRLAFAFIALFASCLLHAQTGGGAQSQAYVQSLVLEPLADQKRPTGDQGVIPPAISSDLLTVVFVNESGGLSALTRADRSASATYSPKNLGFDGGVVDFELSADGRNVFLLSLNNGRGVIASYDLADGSTAFSNSLKWGASRIAHSRLVFFNPTVPIVAIHTFPLKSAFLNYESGSEFLTAGRLPSANLHSASFNMENSLAAFSMYKLDYFLAPGNKKKIIDSAVFSYTLSDGQLSFTKEWDIPGNFRNPVFSPDGKYIAGHFRDEGNNDFIQILDLANRRVLKSLPVPPPQITNKKMRVYFHSIEFSQDGTLALASYRDDRTYVWNVENGSLVATLGGHTHRDACSQFGCIDSRVYSTFLGEEGVRAGYGALAILTRGSDGRIIVWEERGHQAERIAQEFQFLLEHAAQGDNEAMLSLSKAYSDGVGTSKDHRQAELWMQRAASAGNRRAQLSVATALVLGTGDKQDCSAAGEWIRSLKSAQATERTDPDDMAEWQSAVIALEREILKPLGGPENAATLSERIQGDLLEAQMIAALGRNDFDVFLSNLCAFEYLGHMETLELGVRNELAFHRAVSLRAANRPKAALSSLNDYLNNAGRSGFKYQEALQLLQPLQREASGTSH